MVLNETVTEADVLMLGLDRHLTLSVQFVNGAYARECLLVKDQSLIECEEVPSLEGNGIVKLPVHGKLIYDLNYQLWLVTQPVDAISGVWDLPLVGGERVDIKYHYQQLTSGIEVTAVSLEGVLIRSEIGRMYELQSHFSDNEHFNQANLKKPYNDPENFHPAGGLPDDSVLVVRTDALNKFINSIDTDQKQPPPAQEKPLGKRERDTLLSIIAVLCKDAKLDYKKHASTASWIQNAAAGMGISIGETTIENHLKKIPNALASRIK